MDAHLEEEGGFHIIEYTKLTSILIQVECGINCCVKDCNQHVKTFFVHVFYSLNVCFVNLMLSSPLHSSSSKASWVP